MLQHFHADGVVLQFRRLDSTPVVSDPGTARLGRFEVFAADGGVWTFRHLGYGAPGGGGATDLTVSDSYHTHTADSPELLFSATLAPSDSYHPHYSDTPTLEFVGSADLAVDDSYHAHYSDGVVFVTEPTESPRRLVVREGSRRLSAQRGGRRLKSAQGGRSLKTRN